ncbi:MAG: ATP-binding protein involved in chromosome partitioning [Acidimicrobiaceae bacterium]|nr:ATP-binding protein involved in chromosome partitioning [Acidimicrobiaceae bacterium]
MPLATQDAVHTALRGVIDPELGDNVVDLGMVQRVAVDDGVADVTIALTTAGCPLRAQLQRDVKDQVGAVPGVADVKVHFGEMTAEGKRALMDRARWKARDEVRTDIPSTARVAAVASGKGGVGKSSVTANLAVALASRGLSVGVLDADIGGFSIPRMLGLEGRRVEAVDKKIVPLELPVGAPGSGGGLLQVVSMGSIDGTGEDEAVMLRGLMLNRAVQHFLEDVRWSPALDYVLIDMPPGTSDVQMGLARMVPRTEMLIVTTPALAAQKVAARAADMARKGYLRVAGVIENMSAFVCEHGQSYALFGEGGGRRLAEQIGVPLLGSIPLDASVAAGGDAGRPAALGHGPVADAFAALAERVVTQALPPIEMAGCTARLFDQVESALGPAATRTPTP